MKRILFLILTLFCSCIVSHVNKNIEVLNSTEDTFLYLTFSIYSDSITKVTYIDLQNKKEIVGFFKQTNDSYISKNVLNCSFVDKNNRVISSKILDHPLFVRAETLNDMHQLETKKIKRNNSMFILRINRTADLYKLIINEKLENKVPNIIYEMRLDNSDNIDELNN